MNILGRLELPEWPRFLGTPSASGAIRSEAEDFRVDEIPLFEPSGEGNHLWLLVRKTGANTDWVATQLAQVAGCPVRDVGFAGMKDRHAVTSQWFSVPVPPGKECPWQDWEIPDAKILEAVAHTKKLKRGVLKGNRFTIRVRKLQGSRQDLDDRLTRMRKQGLPNYFGAQRFGHNGSNVWRGAKWLKEGGRLPRAKKSIYLSAVRSFLFNRVLALRVEKGNWDSLLNGDVAMLNGSHSVFLAELPNEELLQRCRDFDIHPSGPLPGSKPFSPQAQALDLETRALEPYFELIAWLEKAQINAGRRSFRLAIGELQWTFDSNTLEMSFILPPGAYATTILDELVSTAQ